MGIKDLDGKDVVNTALRLAATLYEPQTRISKGTYKTLEGIVDYGAGLVGGIGGLFNKDFQDNVRKFIEVDAVGKMWDGLGLSKVEEMSYVNELGFVGEVGRDVAEGVGGMLPSLALSLIPGVGAAIGTAVTGVSAGGKSMESALAKGAGYGNSLAYGTIAGVAEGAIEKLGGAVLGEGTSLVGKALAGTALGNATSKGLGKVAMTFVSEAGEELLSDVIDPLNSFVTGVDKNIGENYKEISKPENLLKTAIVGGTVGSVMQGGNVAMNASKNKATGRGGLKATFADDSLRYIQEVSKNYGNDAVKNAKYDKAIAMSLNEISKNITKLDEGSRANYLNSIGPLKNAFDDKGNVKSTAMAKDVNQEAISSNLRAISGTVKYAPVKSSETISEGAKNVKGTIEKVIGEGANVVITNDTVAGDALFNPDDDVIYVNNKANITQKSLAYAIGLHEVTHATEGTEAYVELMNTLEELTNDEKTPQEVLDIIGDIRLRKLKTAFAYRKDLEGRGKKSARYLISTEVGSDLMGDLLGNDYFIEKLAHRNESLVKKMYHSITSLIKRKNADLSKDSIKYLNKLASKFARAIDNRRGGVKLSDIGAMDDEREENELENVDIDNNERYSFKNTQSGMANDKLLSYDEEMTEIISRRGDFIVDSFDKLVEVVNLAFDNPTKQATAYFGIIDNVTLEKIKNSVPNLPKKEGFVLFKEGNNYSVAATLDSIRHIVDGKKNLNRNDVIEYLDKLADTIVDFDTVTFDYYVDSRNNRIPGLVCKKAFSDGTLVSFDLVSKNKRSLLLQTLYMDSVDYEKKKSANTPLMQDASAHTPKARVGRTSNNSISENSEKINSFDKKSDLNVKKDDNRYSRRTTGDDLDIDFVKDEDGGLRIVSNDLELAQKLEKNRRNNSDEAKLEAAEEQSKNRLEELTQRDKFAKNKNAVIRMKSVSVVSGEEFAKGEVDLVTQVDNYFKTFNYKVYNEKIGNVLIDKRGIKDDIAHGIGRKKAASFIAVPDVIKNGKIIDYQKNWKGRNYDTAVIAAPVTIAGEEHYMGVVIIQNKENNRFYVHEVATIKEEGAQSFKTSLAENNSNAGDYAPSVISILQNLVKSNYHYDKNMVYNSKKDIKALIEDVIDTYEVLENAEEEISFVRKEAKDDVITEIWKRVNSTGKISKRKIADLMADKILQNTILADKAIYTTDQVLKEYMHKIDLSDIYEQLEFKQKLKVNSRWMLKDGKDRVSLDKLVAELGKLGYSVDTTSKINALQEINEIYESTKKYINEELGDELVKKMGEKEYKEAQSKLSKELLGILEEQQTDNELAGKLTFVIDKYQKEQRAHRKYKKEFAHDEKRETALGVLHYNLDRLNAIMNHKYSKAMEVRFDEFKGIQREIGRIFYRGNINKSSTREIVGALAQWYKKENEMLGAYFNQEIADKINSFKSFENTKGPLSLTEIWDLVHIISHLNNFFKNYGKIWRGGKLVEIKEIAEKEYEILSEAVDSKTAMYNGVAYNNEYFLTPKAVATLAEGQSPNGELQAHVKELQLAEINRDYECMRVSKKIYEITNSKEKVEWKGKKITCKKLFDKILSEKETITCGIKVDLRGQTVEDVKIPIVRFIEIWLSSKTDKSKRIENVGIALKNANGSKYTFMHPISEERIEATFNSLPKPVQELTQFIQDWMNNEGRQIKYDADIQKQGYSNLIDDIYHSLEVYHFEDGKSLEQIFNTRAIGNYSFDKERVKKAGSIIVIDNAIKKFLNHVQELNTKRFVDPVISDFYKVLQWNVAPDGEKNRTAKMLLEDNAYFGGRTPAGRKKTLFDYFVQLHKDVEGISEGQDPANAVFGKLRGAHASAVLGANLKVLPTQLSSLIASIGELNPATLVRALNPVHLGKDAINRIKNNGSEAAKYSKWAEVRRYDQNVTKAMTLQENISSKMGIFTAGIGLVDSLIVDAEFHQCEKEVQKRYGLKIGTEENKIKAGELLTELGMTTQQNHYASTRSAMMRSKNELVKFLAAFKVDSNMVTSEWVSNIVGVGQVAKLIKIAEKKGDEAKVELLQKRKKQLLGKSVKYTTVILLQCAYMTLLTRLFNKLYDKDDEDEMTVQDIALDMLGAFNGMLPIVSEISSFFIDGYDINNSFYSMLNSALRSIKGISDNVEDAANGKAVASQRWTSSIRSFLYTTGAFFGVPANNINKNVNAIINICSKPFGDMVDSWFSEPNTSDIKKSLSSALKNGDEQGSKIYNDLLYGNYDISIEDNVLKKEMDRLIKLDLAKEETDKNDYSPFSRKIPEILTIDGEEVEISTKDKNTFKTGLKTAERDNAKMVKTLMYKKLDDESKAYCLRVVYNFHHQSSMASTSDEAKTRLVYFGGSVDINILALIMAFAKDAKSDARQSRREKIEAYVRSFGLSPVKASLALRCVGYSDKDRDGMVERYINSMRGLSKEERDEFLHYAKIG